MRAARLHAFGGPEHVQIDQIDDPVPNYREVMIRVKAAVLAHLDVDVMRGTSRLDIKLPHTLGFEAVGEIVQLGPGVEDWRVGDRVVPLIRTTCGSCLYCRSERETLCAERRFQGSAFAELMICDADHLIAVSSGIAYEDLAAIPTAFGTAWHMLFTRGRLMMGETVLVSSVGSGVGSAAVQLAALAGAHVIGTASSDEKLEKASHLGMHEGVNYQTQDLVSAVERITGGRGVDLVFEHVGGRSFQEGLNCLASNGRLVTCGAHGGEVVPFDIIPFFRSEKSIIGSYGSSRSEIAKCVDLAERGLIRPVIHKSFGLSETAAALRTMENRDQFGKILIIP